MSDLEALRKRGRAHLAMGELEDAVSCFRRLAEKLPGDIEALCRLGNTLYQVAFDKPESDRRYLFEEAKTRLSQAIAENERAAAGYEALYWLATTRRALDPDDVATDLLERQIALTDHMGSRELLRKTR